MAGCKNQSIMKYFRKLLVSNICHIGFIMYIRKRPVKLIQRVKIAHSFLQPVSNLFHFIVLSLPMWFYTWLSKNFPKALLKWKNRPF